MKKTIVIDCKDYQLQKINSSVLLILDGEYVNWKFDGIEQIVAIITGDGATVTFQVDGESKEYEAWKERTRSE